ncbi:MAG: hypothetical protein AAGJ40_24320 [Planctomycetota bacterium]
MMSVLFGVTDDKSEQCSQYLNRFCETYTEPLVKFLVITKRLQKDAATDVVHEFWLRKLLEPDANQNLIATFLKFQEQHPTASFRKYLARSLSNFFINLHNSAEARTNRQAIPLEYAGLCEDEHNDPGLSEFDAIWSNHLLQRVLDQVREECLRSDHELKWKIFVALVLRPSLSGTKPDSYKELADRFGIPNPKDIGNAWITVKRMIHRHFEQGVQDYLPVRSLDESVAASHAETQELLLRLASNGRLQLNIPELLGESASENHFVGFDLESNPLPKLFQSDSDLAEAWDTLSREPVKDWLDLQSFSACSLRHAIKRRVLTLEDLQAMRVRAKQLGRNRARSDSLERYVPREIYGLVYLMSIALAKLQFEADISETNPKKLSARMCQYAAHSWLDTKSRTILESYIRVSGE